MIRAVLVGSLILNSGVDCASSIEYQVSHAQRADSATSTAVALGADAQTLRDLSEVYGPPVAVWLPLGACGAAQLAGWLCSAPNLGSYSSVLVSGLAWWTRRRVSRD